MDKLKDLLIQFCESGINYFTVTDGNVQYCVKVYKYEKKGE